MDRVSDKAVKERGILFRGEMVRALLEGRKTQTRRVIKPQPIMEGIESFGESWKWVHGKDWFSGVTVEQLTGATGLLYPGRCPYGKPGDRPWVRESWDVFEGPSVGEERRAYVRYAADSGLGLDDREVLLDSDEEKVMYHYGLRRGWKPSIYMPRWASRITLEITDVRVERVQEISEDDAQAEGIEPYTEVDERVRAFTNSFLYARLWDSMHVGTEFAWSENPWVWVISFRRIGS